MSGHLAPLIGQIMEKEVGRLVESIGYNIVKESVIQPNIDKILNFIGEPKPITENIVSLNKPIFAPDGITAVSIKKSKFSDGDVTRLLEDIEEAKKDEEDYTLQNVTGGLIISNMMLLPSVIDSIRKRNIFCWDICRLFFYSTKAQKCKLLSKVGPVREVSVEGPLQWSYLRQFTVNERVKNTIIATYIIFVDRHDSNFIYSNDNHREILNYIYDNEIQRQIDNNDLNVNSRFEIHILGKANTDLVKKAHRDFTQNNVKNSEREIGATFDIFVPVYHYSVSPWAVLL